MSLAMLRTQKSAKRIGFDFGVCRAILARPSLPVYRECYPVVVRLAMDVGFQDCFSRQSAGLQFHPVVRK